MPDFKKNRGFIMKMQKGTSSLYDKVGTGKNAVFTKKVNKKMLKAAEGLGKSGAATSVATHAHKEGVSESLSELITKSQIDKLKEAQTKNPVFNQNEETVDKGSGVFSPPDDSGDWTRVSGTRIWEKKKKKDPVKKKTTTKNKKNSEFDKAFSEARKSGKKEFTYKGKSYHTKLKT